MKSLVKSFVFSLSPALSRWERELWGGPPPPGGV